MEIHDGARVKVIGGPYTGVIGTATSIFNRGKVLTVQVRTDTDIILLIPENFVEELTEEETVS